MSYLNGWRSWTYRLWPTAFCLAGLLVLVATAQDQPQERMNRSFAKPTTGVYSVDGRCPVDDVRNLSTGYYILDTELRVYVCRRCGNIYSDRRIE